jgi:hypothetical protein
MQSTDPSRQREPLTYFYRTGPVGDVFSSPSGAAATARVAIVGLGIGSMVSYAEPGQHFTLYEIDSAVARMANDTKYFTFLAECRGTYTVVLGDGRLKLAEAPDGHYGMIILDAFSSDAIPVHLLSQEALRLYLSKLEQGGVLVFNISNRYLNLAPVLGDLAHEEGLVCLSRSDLQVSQNELSKGKAASIFVVMARRPEDISKLVNNPNWKEVPRSGQAVWTDQYSNILSLFRWRS